MANDRGEKSIVLVQKWGAGKIAIGSEFKLKDSDRTLMLTQCEGYPNGKFIFTDGKNLMLENILMHTLLKKQKKK